MRLRSFITLALLFSCLQLCVYSSEEGDFEDYEDDDPPSRNSWGLIRDDGVSCYFFNGMPACHCFAHCTCYGRQLASEKGWYGGFPRQDREDHPERPADRTWHEFLREVLKAREGTSCFYYPPLGYNSLSGGNPNLLSEYLDVLTEVSRDIERGIRQDISFVEEFYSQPKDAEEKKRRLEAIQRDAAITNSILTELPTKLTASYKVILSSCPHDSMVKVYSKGLLNILESNFDEALDDIDDFISLANRHNKQHLLNSAFYCSRGEANLEVGRYHRAIEDLTKAITKDPTNKQAYFCRAVSYFETGAFDKALQDYLTSDRGKHTAKSAFVASTEFTKGLLSGLALGGRCAAEEFEATLCHTAYGCGRALWATIDHPIEAGKHALCVCQETAQDFANSCSEVVECCKNIDWKTLEKTWEYVEDAYENGLNELKLICEQFDQLDAAERGELIGRFIGKHGTEVVATMVAGGAAVKGAQALKYLKNANRICNLEAMATSAVGKEAIVVAATEHAACTKIYFKTIQYNYHDLYKHLEGHHLYEPWRNRSIWQHSDPEGLLRKFAGTGERKAGIAGLPGYREKVNFGEHIGIWKNDEGTLTLPTTKGIIHYGKKGAHIIPADPRV